MNALKAKLGPFPRWVWLALLVGAVYLWYRHKNSSGGSSLSTPVVMTPSSAPSGTSDLSSLGAPPSAGVSDSGSSNAATSDLLNAYGTMNSNLLSALLQTEQNQVGLAQTQATDSASQFSAVGPDVAASGTASNPGGQSVATTKPQPGTGNAPTVSHVATTVANYVSSSGVQFRVYSGGLVEEKAKGGTWYTANKTGKLPAGLKRVG